MVFQYGMAERAPATKTGTPRIFCKFATLVHYVNVALNDILTGKLGEQMKKSAELDQLIRHKPGGLRYAF